jgi:single-strand DNA-binding protein
VNETMVTMAGWIVGEVTTRRTADETSWARFRVVVNERRYDSDKAEWADAHSMFVTVHCRRRAGENAVSVLKRGHPVVVHGRLRLWGDPERPDMQVDAHSVGIDLARFADVEQPLAAAA